MMGPMSSIGTHHCLYAGPKCFSRLSVQQPSRAMQSYRVQVAEKYDADSIIMTNTPSDTVRFVANDGKMRQQWHTIQYTRKYLSMRNRLSFTHRCQQFWSNTPFTYFKRERDQYSTFTVEASHNVHCPTVALFC